MGWHTSPLVIDGRRGPTSQAEPSQAKPSQGDLEDKRSANMNVMPVSGKVSGTRFWSQASVTLRLLRRGVLLCSEFVVNLATVRNLNDEDENLVVVNICEDPIVPDSIPPEFLIRELPAKQSRVNKEGELLFKKTTDPLRGRRIKFFDLFRCLRRESDRIAHAGQTTRRGRLRRRWTG